MIRVLLRGVAVAAVLMSTSQPVVVDMVSQASSGEDSIIGTLSAYDARTRLLTVKTEKAVVEIVLDQKASVHLGSRVLPDDEIAAHTGLKVKVRFTDSGGKRTATSVMLLPAP